MKTIKILLIAICIGTFTNNYAQTKDKNIIKVNYSSGCVSDFLVGMLKKQIQDPNELSKMLGKMGEYKVHSSFYQDIKTKESIFVIDSISEVEGLSTPGHTYYVHKSKSGAISGKEIFMGREINFQCDSKELEWDITSEQKEINGYQCKKAQLKNNPKINVWFTPEISVTSGPYVFYGLPGLVLEADSYFQSINAMSISYENREAFQNKLKEVKNKIINDKNKSIIVKEVFTKKENFQRMVENSK
ncbi:GLPGLI family protein [uncultured Lacinutrix sp.]|uniref:GLPGLI family protein n=1 Tax=uncultured Lacinutrix sp. TaxID=574032 RepID=UPI00262C38AC|nr:GLPGLI family protein [uncultured Lacinutrix sp.]